MTPPDPSLAGTRLLVTGAAGFIGHAVALRALAAGAEVTGVDDLSELYYPARLKHLRLAGLSERPGWRFREADIATPGALAEIVAETHPTRILHLAAHAAVMPSFEAPDLYMRANVMGTQAVADAARDAPALEQLVYASTSSVYGRSRGGTPFREDQPTATPISVYGASKVANEATMQAYADRYDLPVTGLRFFKVYGPWGRPDTVFFKFVDRIWRGEPIALHNHGKITHAFTYIDDVVGGVLAALLRPVRTAPGDRHPIYNLGNPGSEPLERCVDLIEAALGGEAVRHYTDLPAGDRYFSRADIGAAERDLGYRVAVPVDRGIPALVDWYREVCVPHGLRF